ncbi:PAS domain-containing protein, partial [bacterium]|nr:PAS domain-containing protein [bacterium]
MAMRDGDDKQQLSRVDAERQRAEDLLRIERDLSIAISSAPSLDEALSRLLTATCHIEGVDCGGVYVVDGATGGLDLAVHQGLPDWFVERVSHFDADAVETGLVMAGKPFYYLSPDAPSGDPTIHQREGLRAVAVIPVLHDGDVVACMNLASHIHAEIPLSTRHALEAIASQIGGILARIRAEEALQEAQRGLHVLVEKRTAELQAANRALNEEIEEHRRSEKALRESEWKYRAIFDQTFQLMGIMTPDGVLTEVNRTALGFGGLTGADVIGKPFWDTPWWTHSAALQEELRAAVMRAAAGEFIRFEAYHPSPDGRTRYVDVSIRPVMDEAGNVVLLISEGRDISEKHEAEEAHLRTAKLEALGVLAGGIAHDFNNLLAGIITNVSLARLSSTDPEALDALADSERAALRASRLTDQLLTFSKGGAPVKTVASIGDIIRETAAFALSGSSTRCRFDLPEDLWPVEIDTSQISQVIQNLVLNASEAMP